jgi:acetyltransferase
MGGDSVEKAREMLNRSGIPTYETPERAVTAFMYLLSYAHNLEILQQIPSKLTKTLEFEQTIARGLITDGMNNGKGILTEVESKALLKSYGIPVNRTELAGSEAEAIHLAQSMGYPVAMKIHSREILHKSEANGVLLNLRNEKEVGEAFSKIMSSAKKYHPTAELLGVTVQNILQHPDYELILGSKKDADFGPVILFGAGGTTAEILKDRAIALPPLNRLLARRLIESTRVHQLLKGYRNRPPANLDVLTEILIRLSQLVIDFPEISELDMNPVFLSGDRAVAVDARTLLAYSPLPTPHHLVISPYPSQYERTEVTKDGLKIFVRPIKPEDAPLLIDLFNTSSRESIYYRFFSSLKSIPHNLLARFTQIDYDRDIALVAVDKWQEKERMLGVARFMSQPGGDKAEFAVLTGDPWQGKGIGVLLMEHLISIARERGMETLYGIVLAENTHMLALARKLGFTVSRVPRENQYDVYINLSALPDPKESTTD